MGEVDQFLGFPSFEESFQESDRGVQVLESCAFDNKCDRYSVTIDLINLNDDQVDVRYQSISGDSSPTINLMTKTEWEKNQGNMLRKLFQNIRSLGQNPQVIKTVIETVEVQDGLVLEGLRVYFGVYSRSNELISDETVLMVREYPGVLQLADYTQRRTFPIKTYDRRSIHDVNRMR
jgi:hypothetical protein